ncbi:MAG: glycosyltransferase 4 family protein [archaeon]
MAPPPFDDGQILRLVFLLGTGFVVTFSLTPLLARLAKKHRLVGIDAHKPNKPEIPDMCGLAIYAALAVSSIILAAIDSSASNIYAGFLLCITISTLIGAWDDLKPLNPKVKPMLTALSAIPMVALGAYNPFLRLPFVGTTRLTLVYPLLVLVAVAVLSNAINMMNPFNGAMSGTCSIASFAMIICLLLLGQVADAVLPSALLGALLAFHYYNRYPAKVFSGNAGDLCVGAAIGALSIIGRVEVPMVIVMIPHISNAFYFLSSVRGLKERRELKARPTKMLPDGRLDSTEDKSAPITLSRIILAKGPLREDEIVRTMIYLTIVSSALATVTLLLWLR